ncbi:MAG TPA: DUF4157 domain-containing protein [Thermoanaerobaculia bacterium]|jgi:hypothetical protein|nr:DUF4157 domain-containing protein [Thermoanaerobaculia bacterium]
MNARASAAGKAPPENAAPSPARQPIAVPNPNWQQLATRTRVQARLTIGAPNDPYEREADRVADQVMRMPAPAVQRKCAKCEEEDKQEVVRAKEEPGEVPALSPEAEASIQGLRGGGRPLPEPVRSYFEPRFGCDLGGVRVHAGPEAASLARSISARAFTVGSDIAFAPGEFQPASLEGRRLIAHELTHTLQQGTGSLSFARCLQRDPAPDEGESTLREATVSVAWADQDQEFYHRAIQAIASSASFKDAGKPSLWQPFRDPIFAFHRSYGLKISPKPNEVIKIRANAFVNPKAFHGRVTQAGVEPEQVAKLRGAKITGVMKSQETFKDRGPNELGPDGVADLSFTSATAISAADVGGLKWFISSGPGSLTGGDDGKATFSAAGRSVILELRTVSGYSVGSAVTSLVIKVLKVSDMVSRDPKQPERLTITRQGLTLELIAEQYYGDKSKATSIWVVWDEKAQGGPLATTTRLPKGIWVRLEYRHLTSEGKKEYDASLTIKSRSEWGAKPPIKGDPNRSYETYSGALEDILDSIVVHHSGNKGYKTMSEVQDLHMGEKQRADIGYHYGISLKGEVFEGRPIGVKGAHVDSKNTGKIGIVLLADLDPENKGLKLWEFDNDEDPLSAEMEKALLKLIHFLTGKYPKIKYLGGHDDYDQRRFCPGKKAMDKMAAWRSDTNLQAPVP